MVGAWEQMGLRVENRTGDVIRDVTVTGSAAAGIYQAVGQVNLSPIRAADPID